MMERSEGEKIPVIVGVTGHRDLRPEDIPALEAAVQARLEAIRKTCPNSPVRLMTGLAEGGDQLCARVAVRMGIPLLVPMPWEADVFRQDFEGAALAEFNALLAAAESAYVPAPQEPHAQGRSYAYRQVGIHVARHCHVLLALWDGRPGAKDGCGTAETVDFMRWHAYQGGEAGCLFAAKEGAVLHITTPRRKNPDVPGVGTWRLLEEESGALDSLLRETNTFNAPRMPKATPRLREVDKLGGDNPGFLRLRTLRFVSSELSKAARDRYLLSLRWLAALSVVAVLSFLLYDEMEANFFLPFYGILLGAAFLLLRATRKRACHPQYLEYRALSEALRVQQYLLLAGIDHPVTLDFPWAQKREMAWVFHAVNALIVDIRATPADPFWVAKEWAGEQVQYHGGKRGAIRKKARVDASITWWMVMLTALIYVLVCVMEYALPQLAETGISLSETALRALQVHAGQSIDIRSVSKILLGVFSAATLFLSSYYGKLSLSALSTSSDTTHRLFADALRALETGCEPPRSVLLKLSREEIIENCIWVSHMRGNEPSVAW